MMMFKELNARTRPFLTLRDIDNKWIWNECKHVINVSQKNHNEMDVNSIKSHGSTYEWIPMGENHDLDIALICQAMKTLLSYNGEDTIIHCDFGNNRSRLVCEFALYAKTGVWLTDEDSAGLDGCLNKTEYNIKHGYLPEIRIVEQTILTSLNEK